jgi:hypothetical protein
MVDTYLGPKFDPDKNTANIAKQMPAASYWWLFGQSVTMASA